MTAAGWIFLILSWGVIIGLTIFCFVKVIISVRNEKGVATNDKNK